MKEIFSGIFFVRKSAKGFLGNSDSRCSLYRVRLVPPLQIFFSTLSTGIPNAFVLLRRSITTSTRACSAADLVLAIKSERFGLKFAL